MSQYEEDAGKFGEELADIVNDGDLTDFEALAIMAGDKKANRKLNRILERRRRDGIPEGER